MSSACSRLLAQISVFAVLESELNPDLTLSDRRQGFADGLFGRRDFGDRARLQGRGDNSQVPRYSSCGRLRAGGPAAGASPQTPTDKGDFHCWVGSARLGQPRDEQATVSFAATLRHLAFNTKGGEGSQMFIMGYLCLVPEFSTCQDTPSFFICHPDQRLLVDGHQLVSNLQPTVLEQKMSGTKI